jgi:hypothetical protein
MGFTKRRKRPEYFRGDNHDPTEEARIDPPPPRVAHPNPDPTHEQRKVAKPKRVKK